MGVVFKKTQDRGSVVTETTQEVEHFDAVDQYVKVKADIDKINIMLDPLVTELANLAAEIRSLEGDTKEDQKVIIHGYEHTVALGKKANISKVTASVDEIFELLGEETFKAVAKFGITDLKKYTPKAVLPKIITVEHTGTRPIKVVS